MEGLTVGVLIPSSSAGKVIGKQGSGLKEIRTVSSCRIELQQDADAEYRRADLTGPSIDHISNGMHLLAMRAFDGDKQPAGPCSLTFMVPDSFVGAVIGKGGENLKRVREATGVKIACDREPHADPASGAQERSIAFTGDAQQMGAALRLALLGAAGGRQVASYAGAYSPPPPPGGHAGHYAREAFAPPPPPPRGYATVGMAPPPPQQVAAAVLSQVRPASGDADEMQVHVVIPGKFIGAILGKEGAQIKQILSDSGCKSVSVTKRENNEVDRRVVIVGGYSQCATAQRAVREQYVAAAKAASEEVTEVSVIMMVPQSAAGAVIGREASTLKRIREESGVRMSLGREQIEGFRLCNLSGQTLEDVLAAEKLVQEQVEMEHANNPAGNGAAKRSAPPVGEENVGWDQEAKRPRTAAPQLPLAGGASPPQQGPRDGHQGGKETTMLVPAQSAGAIIGKQGSGLKLIRERCGVHLEVLQQDKAPQWPNERVVILKGSLSGRQAAVAAVVHAAFPLEQHDAVDLRLLVSSSDAGAVIGRQGGNLKAIRERCQVGVQVDKNEIRPGERLVTANGALPAVLAASHLILESLEASGK